MRSVIKKVKMDVGHISLTKCLYPQYVPTLPGMSPGPFFQAKSHIENHQCNNVLTLTGSGFLCTCTSGSAFTNSSRSWLFILVKLPLVSGIYEQQNVSKAWHCTYMGVPVTKWPLGLWFTWRCICFGPFDDIELWFYVVIAVVDRFLAYISIMSTRQLIN